MKVFWFSQAATSAFLFPKISGVTVPAIIVIEGVRIAYAPDKTVAFIEGAVSLGAGKVVGMAAISKNPTLSGDAVRRAEILGSAMANEVIK